MTIGVDEEYPPNPYHAPVAASLAEAYTYIVDIDGTVADRAPGPRGDTRSPYDYDRVSEDRPKWDVLRVVKALTRGAKIIFVSGREEACRAQTETWLHEQFNNKFEFELYMRSTGDQRPDTIVKRELFDRHIRERDDVRVVGVFDDRNKVVQMWREQLGLTVFHVADHDF